MFTVFTSYLLKCAFNRHLDSPTPGASLLQHIEQCMANLCLSPSLYLFITCLLLLFVKGSTTSTRSFLTSDLSDICIDLTDPETLRSLHVAEHRRSKVI